jgi:uncharacterized protein (TIGR02996 family)
MIDDILVRWRSLRAPVLADALDRIAAARPDALAAQLAPTALKAKQLDDTIERLRALRVHLPDPRVSRALCDFAESVPFTSNSSQRMWSELFELIVEAGDPRAIDRLQRMFAGKPIRDTMRTWLERKAAEAHDSLRAIFPGEITLDIKAAAELASLVERLAPAVEESATAKAAKRAAAATAKTREELLAAVYAAPDDDGPRLVLADVLLEAGDPWGELIALQCRRAPDEKPSARGASW